MKKYVGILVLLAMVLAFAGCTKQENAAPVAEVKTQTETQTEKEQPADSYYPVTVTTHNYAKEPVEITFDKAPEKVIAVYQDSIETLLALGLEDRIIAAAGLDQDVKSDYQAAFEKVNYLTEFSPDKESVMMMEPDFILSWYSYFGEKKLGDVSYWHENGINTYMMLNSGAAPTRTLENEYEDILTLGKIFNVNEKAEAIVAEMKAEVERIRTAANTLTQKPSVLVMEFGKDDVRVYGENTLGGGMVESLGADLVKAEENKMSYEELLKVNPDVIFTVYFGSSNSVADAEAAIAKLKEDPKFASLNAVKENKVHAISLGDVYCSGTRTLDGIKNLAKGIFPDLEVNS